MIKAEEFAPLKAGAYMIKVYRGYLSKAAASQLIQAMRLRDVHLYFIFTNNPADSLTLLHGKPEVKSE